MPEKSIVYIVDPEASVRLSLHALLGGAGFSPYPFACAEDLLASAADLKPGCVLLELDQPGLAGMDALQQMVALRPEMPVILMNGAANVQMAVRALRSGAIDFLEKPFATGLLLDALDHASNRLSVNETTIGRKRSAMEKIARLTSREREVIEGIVAGDPSRVIAHRMGLSTRTIEMFRASAMRRLDVRNVPDLVRISLDAQDGPPATERDAA